MLRFIFALLLLIPTPVFAYHTETQTPYGISISYDLQDGKITVTWSESDGLEDNPPEYYQISYGIKDTADDATVNTDFGFTEALSNQSYVFDPADLYTIFGASPYTFYAKVKAFHDTNGTTSDWTQIVSVEYDYEYIPPTTTTLPPQPTQEEKNFAETGIYETDSERYNREIEEARVKEEEETAIRDEQRKANEEKYGCYMTDAQIERGDCDIPKEEPVEDIKEEPKEEVIIEVDDTKEELPNDDVVVLEVVVEDEDKRPELIKEEDIVEEEVKIDVKELEEEFAIEEEIFELPEEIVIEEEIEDEPIVVVEIEEDVEEVLDEPIQEDVEENPKTELVLEDIPEEQIEEVVEEYVEQLETEEVIEILEEVVVEEITEEEVVVVQAVVEEAIDNVEELTEEQVEVVAEVLQVEKEDVEIIAEAVKEDEAVAEAVEVFVERAVENKDVEDYTLADVVTEIQFETFIENPIEVLVDFEDISFQNIGDDMTSDQKEKAQEVVVPVILTRIASMAAFVFRRQI